MASQWTCPARKGEEQLRRRDSARGRPGARVLGERGVLNGERRRGTPPGGHPAGLEDTLTEGRGRYGDLPPYQHPTQSRGELRGALCSPILAGRGNTQCESCTVAARAPRGCSRQDRRPLETPRPGQDPAG